MSADVNPIEYWTPVTPLPAHAPGRPLFTGPQSAGCLTMLAIVVLAAVLAFGIVAALGWVLA
jgi:hypothetical protein